MTRRTIRWLAKALDDLDQQAQWLSGDEGADPLRTMARIREAARAMERLGDIGRPGRVAGTRELSVRNAPYIIVYRRIEDGFEILAVFHMAQER